MKWKFLIPLLFVSIASGSVRAIAHGVKIEAKNTQAIEIDAAYDNGKPMSEAQVTVYAPDDPATPWLTGTSDENGNFVFTPDRSKPGNWTVQVRKAGHGGIIDVPVTQQKVAAEGATEVGGNNPDSRVLNERSTSRSFTPLQKVLMGAATIWGFVGTALFFWRGKQSPQFQSREP